MRQDRVVARDLAANGLISGEGAGVAIFTAAPGAKNYGNTVSGNILTGNALPGVAMHSHAPGQVLDDNVITRNRISGNGRRSRPWASRSRAPSFP